MAMPPGSRPPAPRCCWWRARCSSTSPTPAWSRSRRRRPTTGPGGGGWRSPTSTTRRWPPGPSAAPPSLFGDQRAGHPAGGGASTPASSSCFLFLAGRRLFGGEGGAAGHRLRAARPHHLARPGGDHARRAAPLRLGRLPLLHGPGARRGGRPLAAGGRPGHRAGGARQVHRLPAGPAARAGAAARPARPQAARLPVALARPGAGRRWSSLRCCSGTPSGTASASSSSRRGGPAPSPSRPVLVGRFIGLQALSVSPLLWLALMAAPFLAARRWRQPGLARGGPLLAAAGAAHAGHLARSTGSR